MKSLLLHNATIVTSGKEAAGSVLINDGKIVKVVYKEEEAYDYHIYNIRKASENRTPFCIERRE